MTESGVMPHSACQCMSKEGETQEGWVCVASFPDQWYWPGNETRIFSFISSAPVCKSREGRSRRFHQVCRQTEGSARFCNSQTLRWSASSRPNDELCWCCLSNVTVSSSWTRYYKNNLKILSVYLLLHHITKSPRSCSVANSTGSQVAWALTLECWLGRFMVISTKTSTIQIFVCKERAKRGSKYTWPVLCNVRAHLHTAVTM